MILDVVDSPQEEALGADAFELMQRLFPLCRSLTGDGVRETFDVLEEQIPLTRVEIPSGTKVLDWTVPDEWNIRDAYIANADGTRVVDFQRSNLHVVSYSEPVRATLSLEELRERLHTLPDQPDVVPYRTSYYDRTWGFCLSHAQLLALQPGDYEVVIDSTLEPGSLSYAELAVEGNGEDEVLMSTYVCHPSLAHDNLSGIAVATMLAKQLLERELQHSYRFLFAPGTIGPLAWLHENRDRLDRIRHGLTFACIGDDGNLNYKRTRRGDAEIDQAVEIVLRDSGAAHRILPWEPWGGDERQFGSPGFDLPVGSLMRTPHGEFAGYHTSADSLDRMRPESLAGAVRACLDVVDVLETNRRCRNLSPFGEPQLGRRGLYRSAGGAVATPDDERALLWVLNQSDGATSLVEVAHRSGLPYPVVRRAADRLEEAGLLAQDSASGGNAVERRAPAEAPRTRNSGPSAMNATLSKRLHQLIPGGAHVYAKGDDQWPIGRPALIERGEGCRVWDTEGREFIEYASGGRAVTLGHVFPPVIEAAARQLSLGCNFTRPAALELETAEAFLELLPAADMVKFTKDGSSATSAAVKLARAHTGRDLVAVCADHPFFSYDDWFIGTTSANSGIPEAIRSLTVSFRYNDIESLRALFREHADRIACVILEAEKTEPPRDRFLHELQDLCSREGAVFVLDEMITGFRYHLGGAQTMFRLNPDLATFGKAIANGFSVSALAGKREIMELAGLHHSGERVFALSATHGGETHALAAALATMEIYKTERVVEALQERGDLLRAGVENVVRELGLNDHFQLGGRACNLVYSCLDAECRPSAAFRTLFLQEMLARGFLTPSFVVSRAHGKEDIDRTVTAVDEALRVYAQALEEGVERHLASPPVKSVYRRFN